jgi:hypothetical protein
MTKIDTANREGATLETAPTRYVEGSGIRFAYRQLGPSTGTPLVLLQHFSGNIDAWDPAVVNALAVDRPVIAFDNAGVGRSTGQTPDNIAAMARDAVTFIKLLGLSEVDLLDQRPDGVHVSYDKMESYLLSYGSLEALAVARNLDAKITTLFANAQAKLS